jgi:outer membrane protein assembly factor BamB
MSDKREHKPIRWWPAVAIVLLCGIVVAWAQLGERTGQSRFLFSAQTIFVGLVLLVVWFAALSRVPWKPRLIGVAVIVLAVAAGSQVLRIRGVTGNLVPIVTWKWQAEPDELLGTLSFSASNEAGSAVEDDESSVASFEAENESVPDHDYPQFLGPNRDATVRGIALARDWEGSPPREVWRREVGAGWSSFAVRDGMAVTQEQRGPHEMVVAYDLATGDVLWAHSDPERFEKTIGGIGPRATPTISDGRVYTLGATGLLNALELATGEKIWSRNILEDAGASSPDWGKSCSPLVVDGLVVVSAGGPDGKSLLAYDIETGQLAWGGGRDASGYSSPLIATLSGVRQIVIFNKGSVSAHDPANGDELWSFPWPEMQPNVAQPLPLPGDRLLVSSGYGVGSKLLEIGGDAQAGLEVDVVWESPRLKAKFTTVVHHEGTVYGLDDGVLVALDPETGERRWKRGRYGHGQVLLVGDLLVVQTEDGEIVLVEANPNRHVELGRIEVVDGRAWNTPALVGPYLLVRNDREAVCLELPTEG